MPIGLIALLKSDSGIEKIDVGEPLELMGLKLRSRLDAGAENMGVAERLELRDLK